MMKRIVRSDEIVFVGAHPTSPTQTELTGVLLDEASTDALIVEAFDTGLISSITRGESTYETNFLAENRNRGLAMRAAQQLILYGKLWLAGAFDNFDVTPLAATGLVAVSDMASPRSIGGIKLDGPTQIFRSMGLVPAARAYLASTGTIATTAEIEDVLTRRPMYEAFSARLLAATEGWTFVEYPLSSISTALMKRDTYWAQPNESWKDSTTSRQWP